MLKCWQYLDRAISNIEAWLLYLGNKWVSVPCSSKPPNFDHILKVY